VNVDLYKHMVTGLILVYEEGYSPISDPVHQNPIMNYDAEGRSYWEKLGTFPMEIETEEE
jgi:hypothetical protein